MRGSGPRREGPRPPRRPAGGAPAGRTRLPSAAGGWRFGPAGTGPAGRPSERNVPAESAGAAGGQARTPHRSHQHASAPNAVQNKVPAGNAGQNNVPAWNAGQRQMVLGRLHPIAEAVASRPREIEFVLFDSGRKDRRINELRQLCRSAGVAVRYGDSRAVERLAGPSHQGAAARLAVRGYFQEEEALAGTPGRRFLIVLDEVQDPHNLGAILRVADGAGARVAVPERGSAPLSETVERTSAGALERVPVIRTGNLRRFLDGLKGEGFQVIGLDPEGEEIYRVDLTGDLALVVGAEGRGLRRLVREGCDRLVRLPMKGSLASLNVSTATAAAAWEAIRQRDFSSEKP